MTGTLLVPTDAGLHCPAGGFHVDPWRPVARALVTHAHGDHLAWGGPAHLTAAPGAALVRARLGAGAAVEGVPYGEPRTIGGVRVSFHPAGHILGSAQVRLEYRGEVWVVSGDYKLEPDRTCTPFEPVRCHTFVTESTFGLPLYRWRPQAEVLDELNGWWRTNAEAGVASVVFAYALGKAQRLLAGLDPGIGPLLVHGAVQSMSALYRAHGVPLPATTVATAAARDPAWRRALVVAPPSAAGSPWVRRFAPFTTALASGWMQLRGTRRRRGVERGIVLSDHADWPGLLAAIEATGAERVWVTHGYTAAMVRWLHEQGLEAAEVATRWAGEGDVAGDGASGADATGGDAAGDAATGGGG